ncbi:hypothetical protein WCLE_009380 [Wolbachia endosymbiont of Cimex lectularius]|nr:hypothetical protein WCLE_009380 [Wolbachia endosymbiont of Cimex lectularius]
MAYIKDLTNSCLFAAIDSSSPLLQAFRTCLKSWKCEVK